MANLREYILSTGKKVLLGKSAETNEELVKQAENSELLLHTAMPGSPFANIKTEINEITKSEIYEAAVMCAKHSQDWRDSKRDIKIHSFLKSDMYKEKGMSLGTFGVKKFKEIIVKKNDILDFEKTINIR